MSNTRFRRCEYEASLCSWGCGLAGTDHDLLRLESARGLRRLSVHALEVNMTQPASGTHTEPVLIYCPGLGTFLANTADGVADVLAAVLDRPSQGTFSAARFKHVTAPHGLTLGKTVQDQRDAAVLHVFRTGLPQAFGPGINLGRAGGAAWSSGGLVPVTSRWGSARVAGGGATGSRLGQGIADVSSPSREAPVARRVSHASGSRSSAWNCTPARPG